MNRRLLTSTQIRLAGASLIAGAIAVLAWCGITIIRELDSQREVTITNKVLHLADLDIEIARLDEALTSAARLYATTGRQEWKDLYAANDARMVAILEEIKSLASLTDSELLLRSLVSANDSLVVLERKALDLTETGAGADAEEILNSSTYAEAKEAFLAAHQRLTIAISGEVVREEVLISRVIYWQLGIACIVMLVVAAASARFFQLAARNTNAREHEQALNRIKRETGRDIDRLNARYASIFNALGEGVVMQGADGAIVACNPAAERVLGLTADEIMGRVSADPRWRAVRADGSEFPGDAHPISISLRSGASLRGVIMGVHTPAGELRWLTVNSEPIWGQDGEKPVGAVATFHDVSARLADERKLRHSHEMLRELEKISKVGAWEVDLDAGKTWFSDEVYPLLGIPREEIPDPCVVAKLVEEPMRQKIIDTFVSCREHGTEIEFEAMVGAGHADQRWLRFSASRRNEAGRSRIVGVVRDISRQKADEEFLSAARDHAESANRAKSEFLANMSHEIRTPLNGVLGVAAVLLRGTLTEEQREMVSIITESGRTLEKILSDVLDFSKIEVGRLAIEQAPLALAKEIASVAALMRHRAQEKGLALAVFIEPELNGNFTGDATRIKQIVGNLLSNAIKFTGKGTITLSATWVDGTAEIAVSDTGIGMNEDAMSRLFQRFSQADGTITRRYGGTGLGLAIVSSLVKLMGGSINAESKIGRGSTFTVRLPLPRIDLRPALERPQPLPSVASPGSLKGRRILLVDDHPINRRVVEMILKPFGVDLTQAEDGAQGVAAFRSGSFDLVLMDMQMPVMDGLAATRSIRHLSDKGQTVPIIMITANALPEHRDASYEAGANAHVTKPVAADKLIAAIQSLLPRLDDSSKVA